MNIVEHYLSRHWRELGLDRLGPCESLSSAILTPGFQASGHVIFFVFLGRRPEPVLVAKVPRLAHDHGRLAREAQHLRALQGLREGGLASIPRLVAFDTWAGRRILVETTVAGTPMNPAFVRRHDGSCLAALLAWLIDVHRRSRHAGPGAAFPHLVEPALERLERLLAGPAEDGRAILDYRRQTAALGGGGFPLVYEHGDLGSPNVLVDKAINVGVVDWELADMDGPPLGDLFFFLTYVAFARANARRSGDCVRAFDAAFFRKDAWTRPYILHYARQLELDTALIRPLFFAHWCRYVDGLVQRLTRGDSSDGRPKDQLLDWLRGNRYYALFRHTAAHAHQFVL
ncbi:MAG: aminoglycoside phosphotransferase family protein [Pseudomonadota bacterium]|nr:aminoglycoside phosphotransferase family protein [Pseudomonadota bacterium]